jgi:hypothetical protein
MEIKSDAEMIRMLLAMKPGAKVEVLKMGDIIFDLSEVMTEEDVDREMNLEGLIKNRPPIL